MCQLISEFFWFEKDNYSKLLVKENSIWTEIRLSNEPYIAFVNGDPEISFEGIKIHICENSCESFVQSDSFGSVPCFHYQQNGVSAITTVPFRLFQELGLMPDYDLDKMLDYFILSYHALDNRTIYKGLNFITVGSKLNLKGNIEDSSFKSIYSIKETLTSPKELARELIEVTKIKLSGVDPSKLVLLLTSGKDSLIGALLVKLLIGDVDCATFGFEKSVDLEWSALRHKRLFPDSNHFKYNIEDFNISCCDDISYSTSLGGFGPYTSIYYESFLSNLSKFGKEFFIFSDHFEAIRKKIIDSKYFVENYTTPKEVVNRYFADLDLYNNHLEELEKSIFNKYKLDPLYEFYFYDRNSRGMFYKNTLARKYGKAKITLINNAQFLNRNYNFIRESEQFPYNGILDYLLQELGIEDRSWIFPEQVNTKPIPIQPINDLIRVRSHFLNLLAGKNTEFIDSIFKRDELVRALTTMDVGSNDPWLLLRIYQILIAKNYAENINM